MNTQILKSVKSKWFVLCAVILMSKFCLAFGEVKISGPEGTNTPYNLSNFDITIGKIKMPDIATGSTSGHLLLVKESTNGWVREMPLYTGGTGISVSGSNVVTNTAPDQTVTITAGFGTAVTGTYPNFTISQAKKRETSSGTTNASGTYTFTFAQTYSVAPNVQANIINGTDTQIIRIGTPSTTSVTVTVRNRTDVVGLLPTWSNVNGASVDIIVTEK
jgi:hypothetical protein